jgi:cyclopropane fatty-acyl-phospholipid synthase-like methyltransferase
LECSIETLYYTFKKRRRFWFKDNFLKEFYHFYNATWRGSRAVEIPIGKMIIDELIEEYNGDILEVGNVLNHYFKEIDHKIVDLCEEAEGVINEDIETFNPKEKYDLIISISTIEHIEGAEKIRKCLDNIISLLKDGGKFVFTFTLGYNKDLDLIIEDKKFTKTIMKKVNNTWKEVKLPKEYDFEDGYLLIGEIKKEVENKNV